MSSTVPNAPILPLTMISSTTSSESMFDSNNRSIQPQNNSKLEKLRIIKPFDERQLLNFYQNQLLDENDKFMQYFHERYLRSKDRNEYYSLILKLDRSLVRFRDIGQVVRKFVQDIRENETKCWTKEEKRILLSERCGDGQLVESSHTYDRYNFDTEIHQSLERFYYLLRERLLNDHVVHSYFRKYFQLRFELVIYEACDIIGRLSKKPWLLSPPPAPQTDLSSPDLASTTNCSSSVFDDDSITAGANRLVPIDPEIPVLKQQLLELLAGLFTYYRRTNVVTDDRLKLHCYQAIVLLCGELTKIATFHDRLFLLNQILRCPSASSHEFAPLIEFPDPLPLKSTQYDLGREFVDYSVTAIATILSPNIGGKGKEEKNDDIGGGDTDDTNDSNRKPDNSWLLIDDDFDDQNDQNDDEVVFASLSDLTENDIIKYLSRIPFRQILQFMSLITDNPQPIHNNQSDDNNDGQMTMLLSCTETSMIRLFAFNTKLIQIFRNGLQNFNCLRYKKLTLYIASMIKLIIKTISENWRWCKEKFTTNDQALLIRLQVEFDHFMLRSIMAILASNRRGIWPLLSKIDFEGISEPMLWHILWVVYNNGRNENNEMVSGLCPYMSANYWKEKFRTHSQWKFVFIEKLSILSKEEADGVLDFLFNMAISRTSTEMFDYEENNQLIHHHGNNIDDFLHEIIERIAEICLLKKISDQKSTNNDNQKILALKNQNFYSTKGVTCLVKLIHQFKSMLVVLLNFIQSIEDPDDLLVQPCLDLFKSITINDWKPETKFLSILYKWLQDHPPGHPYNRFARILLSKVGWNRILIQSDQCLMIPVQQQHLFALKIYHAVENHFKKSTVDKESSKTAKTIHYPVVDRNDLNDDRLLELATAIDNHSFGCWCWSILLSLRLHPLDLIPDESCWDDIIFGNEDHEKYGSNTKQKHWTMQFMARFNYDTEISPLVNDMENGNNPFAIYIGAMISDLLFHSIRSSSVDLKKLTEINESLAKTGHFIPMIQILYHFLPFLFEFEGNMRSNSNLIASLMSLIQNGYEQDLCSIILLQIKHFDQPKYSYQVCQAWTETLFECLHQCLNLKSTSWFSSWLPQFLSSSSSIPNVIDSILTKLTMIFDRIAMGLLIENDWSILKLYLQYLTRKLYGRMINWKLSHLESINVTNSPWYSSWMSSDQCPVTYLPDKTLIKSPWMTPFHLLLRHTLNNFQTKSSTLEENQIPGYLIFLTTEADIRRTYHVWNRLLIELRKKSKIDSAIIESELENVCRMFKQAPLPLPLLPINMVTVYLLKLLPIEQNISLKLDRPHPLIPLLWRQFFSQYFLYTADSLHAVGIWIMDPPKIKALIDRLNALFDHHNQRWILMNNERSIDTESDRSNDSDSIAALRFEDRLVKLYRAFRIWLKDERFLQYADLDDEQFSKPEIQIKLLISVVLNSKIYDNNQQNITTEYLGTEFDHINSFFFLNYVNKSKLFEIFNEYQKFWIKLIKHDDLSIEQQYLETENNNDDNENIDEMIKNLELENNPIKTLIEYPKSEQFGQIIDYFQKLTSTLNCNILFIENDIISYNNSEYFYSENNMEISTNTNQQQHPDISIVFVIIHQVVDSVVQEARFVENQMEKFTELNNDLIKDVLPKLYLDVRKEHREKKGCDRAEFDASGCTKPAVLKFEFVESVLNNYMKQKYDRNRAEFEAIVTLLTEEVPGQKVVASIYFMSKICHYLLRFFDGGDPKSEINQQKIQKLLETMTIWINSINSINIKYHITGQLLDIFLEFLSKLSNQYIDEVNYFYLNTALQPSVSMNMTQQLAPCLSPSKTTPEMFIKMYKLIGSSLSLTTSQQTIFVLLSKFDVSTWLQQPQVTDQQRIDLLNCLFQCFAFFGTNPNDEFLVTYDLYRKHLQDMILFRFPMFMSHIINFMLQGMHEQVLAPALWNSILHTFGFYTKSLSFVAKYPQQPKSANDDSSEKNSPLYRTSSVLDFDFKTFDDDLRSYLLRQKLFSSHEIFDILNLMIAFNRNLQQQMNSEFLDHFKIYNVKFLQFLTFISYFWISSNSANPPDDLTIVWNPFFENWRCWIFPRFQTKFIQLEHFRFSWQLFIQSIQFMLDSFYDGQSQILSCLWQNFIQFILETRSVETSDIEMFESKILLIKNWDKFSPGPLDIRLMYESVLSKRYSIDRLNSYVISKINWIKVLLYSPISLANSIEVLDNLAYTIIALIDQTYIAELNFSSIPFLLLPSEKVKKIVTTLLEVMKKRVSVNGIELMVLSDRSESKHFHAMIQLLRSVCQLIPSNSNEIMMITEMAGNHIIEKNNIENQHSTKVTYYAQCIGSLISYVCNHCTELVAQNPDVIRIFLKDSVESLRPTIDHFETEYRVSIFCELLQTLNEIQETPLREKLSVYFVTIFSYLTSPEMFAEIMFAIGKIIYSIKTSIYLLECLIENYFDLAGDLNYLVDNLEIVHLNKHLNNFSMNGEEIEDFIMESVKTRSCLMLLIYIYRRLRHRTVPDICTRKYIYNIIGQCASHLKFGQSSPINSSNQIDEAKICFFWTRIFDLLTFDHSSISETLNISVHHLTSLKSTTRTVPTTITDPVLNCGSLIESPIVVYSSNNQNTSLSSLNSSTGSSARSSPTENCRLTLDIHNEDVFNAVQTLMQLCRSLNGSISDSMSRGFFAMFRQQKPVSEWFLFLLQCLVLHGICTVLEAFFPDSFSLSGHGLIDTEKSDKETIGPGKKDSDIIKNKLKCDLEELFRTSMARLRSWKKNKQFQEIWPSIEIMMELVRPPMAASGVPSADENSANPISPSPDTNDPVTEQQQPFLVDDEVHEHQERNDNEHGPMVHMESMTKQWLRYYLSLQQHQQRRFHTIQRWLLECYFDHNYMKHFG